MSADPAIAVLLVLSGPAIGSFLGVLADRLPRGQDVIRAGSACRGCGQRLGWRDLIPILSYLNARGRCRHCGGAIPPWLLYSELAATGLAGVAVWLGGSGAEMLLAALWLWLLLALALSDLIWFRLPDVLTGGVLATALALSLVTGWPPPGAALIGAALGSGSFLAIRWAYAALRGREGLGLGDVKLMAGLGAALGWQALPLMLLMAALGTLGAAGVAALRGARGIGGATPLPFGAALCGAAGLLWVLMRAGGIGPGLAAF